MNVYYSKKLWSRDRYAKKLTPVPLQKTILWGKRELFIPAVYVGKAGVVLDVCEKISINDMAFFLKKWDRKRRLSLTTQEELEQIHEEDPGSQDFITEMSLDDSHLACRISGSLMWYPPDISRLTRDETDKDLSPAMQVSRAFDANDPSTDPDADWLNDKISKELMNAYGCDQGCCWHFGRISYEWKADPILNPQKISLYFQARPVPVTAGYFTTDLSSKNKKITILHPTNNQHYELTVLSCEPMQHSLSFAKIGRKGILYPEHSQVLTYRMSPELPDGSFAIRDCCDGDHPRKADSTNTGQKTECLSSSVFIASNHRGSDHAAVSSLHFEPVSIVQWRAVFQVKKEEDLSVSFPVPGIDL